MKNIWILVVGKDRAKVLEAQGSQHQLRERNVIEWHETLDHYREESIVAKPAAYARNVPHRDTGALRIDPQMSEFADQISTQLDHALKHEEFQRLIIMAPEETLVLIKAALGPEVRKLVELDVNAELINEDTAVIRASLPEIL